MTDAPNWRATADGFDKPVGIGPVIAGWHDGRPVYWVDLVFLSGETRRLTFPKQSRHADRAAKLDAIRRRIALAQELRPHVVLAHDQSSLTGLVEALSAAKKVRTERRLHAAA